MGVAVTLAATLCIGGTIGAAAVSAPNIGFSYHPRVSLGVCVVAVALAAGVLCIHLAAPLINRAPIFSWDGVVIDYFLAMANRVFGAPYPFFWSPRWIYAVGGLTWMMAVAGILAVAAAFPARRASKRGAYTAMIAASVILALYVAAGTYAAFMTRYGIGV